MTPKTDSSTLCASILVGVVAISPLLAHAQTENVRSQNAPLQISAPVAPLNARHELKRAAEALVKSDLIGTKLTPAQEIEIVHQNSVAFEILDSALKLNFEPAPFHEMAPMPGFEGLANYRKLARLLALRSRVQARANDFSGAAQSALDTLRLSHKIQNGGVIITSLVAQAIEAIGRRALGEVVPKLNATTAKNLARQIEILDTKRHSHAQSIQNDSELGRTEIQKIVAVYPPEEQIKAMARYDQLLEWQIVQAQTPYLLSEQRLTETPIEVETDEEDEEEFELAPNAPRPDVEIVVEKSFAMLSPIYATSRFSLERNRTSNLLLMTQLALQAFELDNKRSAKSLDELVPTYLSRAPRDPFNVEETLQWKILDDKRVLYSIGPDGLDDGGRVFPTKNALGKLNTVMISSARGDMVFGINAR